MDNARARRGGGTSTDLTVHVAPLQPLGAGGGADWFGPGQPMPAMAQQVAGRTFDFPFGYNQQTRRRPYEAIGFDTLRTFANAYDLLRLVIETRKDEMAGLAWHIRPRDKKVKLEGEMLARCQAVEAFWREPYPGMEWEDWLRLILEDLFVLDAPTLYPRLDRAGRLYGFKPLDGGTINRLVDRFGDTPPTPNAAYVQILKGMAAVHYRADELIYRPRNMRTNKVFGFSPVEQIITTINLGISRETWQLGFFTKGTLPDALIGVPDTWTPDQISRFQDWFDIRLQGDVEGRRGATFVPGNIAKSVYQTKEAELFDKADEWLARVVCFAFSCSPQPFVQQMNRATADNASESAESQGLEPTKGWVRRLVNYCLRTRMNAPDLELGWVEDDDTDPKDEAERLKVLTDAGIMRPNESRAKLGLDPDPAPEANELHITTNAGPVFLATDKAAARAKALEPAQPPSAPGAGGKSTGAAPSGRRPAQAKGAKKAADLESTDAAHDLTGGDNEHA